MVEKRFDIIYKQGKLETQQIIRDNETGVLYLQIQSGFGTGLSVVR